ncbi:MAG: hypothetical protein IPI46_11755 [Bacteroidetes bacterium]|nr:hypothetical protein [Bacteroidota bacterium]
MCILSLPIVFNQSAFLLTPCFSFSTTSKPYLRFWYHMYGVDQGTLHVDAFVNGAWQLDIMPAKSGKLRQFIR